MDFTDDEDWVKSFLAKNPKVSSVIHAFIMMVTEKAGGPGKISEAFKILKKHPSAEESFRSICKIALYELVMQRGDMEDITSAVAKVLTIDLSEAGIARAMEEATLETDALRAQGMSEKQIAKQLLNELDELRSQSGMVGPGKEAFAKILGFPSLRPPTEEDFDD